MSHRPYYRNALLIQCPLGNTNPCKISVHWNVSRFQLIVFNNFCNQVFCVFICTTHIKFRCFISTKIVWLTSITQSKMYNNPYLEGFLWLYCFIPIFPRQGYNVYQLPNNSMGIAKKHYFCSFSPKKFRYTSKLVIFNLSYFRCSSREIFSSNLRKIYKKLNRTTKKTL